MNGGIRANLLKIAQESGTILKPEDEEFMNKILSLPKNVWISIDADGEPITQKQSDAELMTELCKYKPIK